MSEVAESGRSQEWLTQVVPDDSSKSKALGLIWNVTEALASYPACNSECESDGTVVNTDCFSGYDPSILGNVDPAINSLRSLIDIMTVYQCCI